MDSVASSLELYDCLIRVGDCCIRVSWYFIASSVRERFFYFIISENNSVILELFLLPIIPKIILAYSACP